MTSEIMTSEKLSHFQNYNELIDLTSPAELISDEQRPSLLDVSMTESVCSDSTMDLEPRLTLLTNNYVDDTNCNSTYGSTGCSGPASMEMSCSNVNSNLGKSVSMHDVSNILPLQLTPKSTNTVSCETILSQSLSSTTKSKDSGFHRSTSCLSLTSSRRNYDHVPSKVKEYIRNIKESEALWKKNKLAQQSETIIDEPVPSRDENSVLDKEDLIIKIHELQHELCEKAQCIAVQQNMYSELMMQLAQAKTTIDSLRLRQLSWNYSGVNLSQNTSSKLTDNNFDLETYIQDLNVNQKQSVISSDHTDTAKVFGESVSKDEGLPTVEIPNCSPSEQFRPKKHSTPDKKKNFKRLSPVGKMFSSSSRLDKNFEPLSDLYTRNYSISLGPENEKTSGVNTSCCECLSKAITDNYVSKPSAELNGGAGPINNKLMTVRIDLPNVDPFDKVKKWQASLPNINLVGTHSSSDCDVTEPRRTVKRVDEPRARSECPLNHKQKEVDINCILSMELMEKCKISEKEDSGPTSEQVRNNKQPSRNTFPEHSKDMKPISFKSNNLSNKKSHLEEDSTRISPSLSQYRSDTTCKRPQKKRLNERQKIVFESDDSSSSECESHSYLPKSSSYTCTIGKVLKRVSSDNDDSSSVSSSVLGSPTRSPNKRRSPFMQINGSGKTKKLTSRTNFVLQEPKLNVTVPVKNLSKTKNQRSSFTDDIICKNSNFNKTESSQRKAWNARNNTNFNVCKEFYIKRSSSLQDCHSVMEGMMRDGAVIIGDILHRSHC